MLRIQQLRLPVSHDERALHNKICRILKLRAQDTFSYSIVKRSVDARKKPELFYSYVVDVKVENEKMVLKRKPSGNVVIYDAVSYVFPKPGTIRLNERPLIVGSGPAGLFCGLFLARHGYRPIILERGKAVEERKKDVETFWNTGVLNPESNVQFGEGGAGTFSDGKLNTLNRDKDGKNRKVLEIFVEAGADEEILYDSKPHIGTDVLENIIISLRREIQKYGGEIRFSAKLTTLVIEEGGIKAVILENGEQIASEAVVLAIGHSARDTFENLADAGVAMEAKSFAVGFRVEHPQSFIDISQYGSADHGLSAAPYKLVAGLQNGRSVYSFCMCPGGYVVNASSEAGGLAVNGMSCHARDSYNANSAIIVSVTPEDFGYDGPLAGVRFQRDLEKKTYELGRGRIPVQKLGDMRLSFGLPSNGSVIAADDDLFGSCKKGRYTMTDLSGLLPVNITESFLDGMQQFDRIIKGFGADNVLVSAIESRTSSPVRILRDDNCESSVKGLYPCGEGAGYAGGIMSAAMDGIRVAEQIASKYAVFNHLETDNER